MRPIAIGEPGAVLTTEMLPVALPAVVGANFAVNEVLWPAASVAGIERPVIEKPVPEAVACETVTLAVPEFVKVTATDPFAPTRTLPKLTLDGFAARAPRTPVPVTGIDIVESLAVLLTEILPVALPEVVGENCAVKLAD